MDTYRYRGFTLMRLAGGIWIVSGLLPGGPFATKIEAQRAIDQHRKGQ